MTAPAAMMLNYGYRRRTAGAWAGGSTSLTPDLPASVGAGDMMVLFVGCKPYNATIAAITGWTRLGTQQTNGTTGAGTDTGWVAWTVFYRAWQTGDTAPTVSITSGNSSLACINGYTKGATSLWATPTAYFGSDTSSGTGYSATASGSSGNISVDDYLLHCTDIAGNDADLNTPTISATSATFGTPAKSPATNGSTNTGTDLRAGCAHSACGSGTSSADAVVGWTLSAAQTGGSAMVRLREIPPVTRSPSAGTLRTVGQTPTINQTWSASPTAGALRFAGQEPTVDSGGGEEASPTVGTLRFAGQQPTLNQTWSASPTVGSIRLSGQQPDIDQTWSATPSVGAFRFAGQTPDIDQTWSTSPTAGAVVFAGQQPDIDVTDGSETSALVDFGTPNNPPLTGTDQQRFRVLVRKSGAANPTVRRWPGTRFRPSSTGR